MKQKLDKGTFNLTSAQRLKSLPRLSDGATSQDRQVDRDVFWTVDLSGTGPLPNQVIGLYYP